MVSKDNEQGFETSIEEDFNHMSKETKKAASFQAFLKVLSLRQKKMRKLRTIYFDKTTKKTSLSDDYQLI